MNCGENSGRTRDSENRIIDKMVAFLRIHGKTIGAAGYAGDKDCQQMMSYYKMLTDCQDGMIIVLLDKGLEKWAKAKGVEYHAD